MLIFDIIIILTMVLIIITGSYAIFDIVIFDCLVINKIRRKLGVKDL